MTIVSTKRSRVEESPSPATELKHFFNKLPFSIEKLIYSFINISTAHSLILTNKSFKVMIPNFFVYSPSNLNPFLSFIENAKRKGAFSLPLIWKEALNAELRYLKHIIIIPGSFDEQEFTKMFSKGSNLEKIEILYGACREDEFRSAIASPNLTELHLDYLSLLPKNTSNYPFFPLWNSLSLKKLRIRALEDFFSSTNTNSIILPNLTSLSLSIYRSESKISSFNSEKRKKHDLHLNSLIASINSISKLEIFGDSTICNETLLKLTNLRYLRINSPTMDTLMELKNIHWLENLHINVFYNYELLYDVECLNDFASIIKNLPNLKKLTIEYDFPIDDRLRRNKYLHSELDNLDKLHVIIDLEHSRYGKLRCDSIAKIRSFTLKINFWYNELMDNFEQLPLTYYKDFYYKLSILPGLKDIQVEFTEYSGNLNYDRISSDDEEILIIFFDQLSHKISSIQERTPDHPIWTTKIIAQLQNKKLINCTRVYCSFLLPNETSFSNDQIFQLFPKLTWENLTRISKDQFAILRKIEM